MESKKRKSYFTAIKVILVLFLVGLTISLNSKIKEYEKNLENEYIIEGFKASFTKKIESNKNDCPNAIGGNEDAYLRIKYFTSPFCPWCIREESILKELLKEHGNLFNIRWYDVNSCREEVEKYKVGGVPTFVFSTSDEEEKEYSHYGFIYKEDLKELICNVTGSC